jgi:hypothetical protein
MRYIGYLDSETNVTVEHQQFNDETVVFSFPESGNNGVLLGHFSVSASQQVSFSIIGVR